MSKRLINKPLVSDRAGDFIGFGDNDSDDSSFNRDLEDGHSVDHSKSIDEHNFPVDINDLPPPSLDQANRFTKLMSANQRYQVENQKWEQVIELLLSSFDDPLLVVDEFLDWEALGKPQEKHGLATTEDSDMCKRLESIEDLNASLMEKLLVAPNFLSTGSEKVNPVLEHTSPQDAGSNQDCSARISHTESEETQRDASEGSTPSPAAPLGTERKSILAELASLRCERRVSSVCPTSGTLLGVEALLQTSECTVVVRGVPTRYFKANLLELWDPSELGFNLIFLPYSSKQHRSATYCFINFVAVEGALAFEASWSGKFLPGKDGSHHKGKPLEISLAKVQGFWQNIKHFGEVENIGKLGSKCLPTAIDRFGNSVDFNSIVNIAAAT